MKIVVGGKLSRECYEYVFRNVREMELREKRVIFRHRRVFGHMGGK
jgi:hypothetical protein